MGREIGIPGRPARPLGVKWDRMGFARGILDWNPFSEITGHWALVMQKMKLPHCGHLDVFLVKSGFSRLFLDIWAKIQYHPGNQ